MFKPAVKSELCQISLTGMRAIVLIGLLLQKPLSLDEIKKEFVRLNLSENDTSTDTIRIDINTLKTMGCEISRADKKTNGKFVLTKHPFLLNITREEVTVLKQVYKKIKNCIDVDTLMEYDLLFKKIAELTADDAIKQEIYGISVLKSYNKDLLYELIKICNDCNIVTLLYKSPTKKYEENITLSAQKLVLQNDKIYLQGFNINIKEAICLNIKRIKEILSKHSGNNNIISKPVLIKFFLKEFGVIGLNKDETIVEQVEDGYIIQGKYHNDFLAMQRILSFGSDCIVIEPDDFKEKVIQNLKNMRNIYKDE